MNEINASLHQLFRGNNIFTLYFTPIKKRAIIWPKFCGWLPILMLTCILQWYILLQAFNKINASLQKLLIGTISIHQQNLSQKKAVTQPKFGGRLPDRSWPVFYSDIKFCKVWTKSMHPFKNYWAETKCDDDTNHNADDDDATQATQ